MQTHFIPLCVDFGMPQVEAASVLAMMGAFDFVGTIASGWLSDRYDNRWLLFWYYGLRGLSLLCVAACDLHALRHVGLRGLLRARLDRDGAADRAACRPRNFGPRARRIVFGWVFTGHQLGAAIGGLRRAA